MSSGETESEPSPIDGTGSSGVCTPSLAAISATFSGPTSSVSWA